MPKASITIFIVLLFACNQASNFKSQAQKDSLKIKSVVLQNPQNIDTAFSETSSEPFYLVEVASGYSFDTLKAVATTTASTLGSKFDMLGRIYRPNKGIILPDDSEDELYRSEYYPRRPFGKQDFVSIEMSTGFDDNESDTLKMVVLANIFKSKAQADSVTALLRNKISSVKTVRQDLFLGCMH